MVRRTIGAALAGPLLVGLACGGEATAEAEFAEICGEVGPVRVLELGPDESMDRPPFMFGARVVHSIMARDPRTGQMGVSAWMTGPCGEAPRRVAEGLAQVFTSERWPELLLGCDAAGGQMLVLDPEGAAPPHVLFTGFDRCTFHWTATGLVSVADLDGEDGEDGQVLPQLARLLWHPYPADPARETVAATPLLTRMRVRSRAGQTVGLAPRSFDAYALAVTEDDTLVRVGLADGAVVTVQTGVAGFMVDPTGRYVLWQDATPTDENISHPAGKVFLRDRDDGSDVFLGQTALAGSPNALRDLQHGVLHLNFAQVRVFSLPDLSFIDLPRLGGVRARIDADRWLMHSYERVSLVELVSGAATTLYRGYGEIVRVHGDGFELLQVPPCCQDSRAIHDEGPLWFVAYSGESRRLARRMTRLSFALADGRRVTRLDVDDRRRGTLTVTDPETQEALRIDDGVEGFTGLPQVYGDDALVYTIPDGPRAGVWIARLAPAR